MVSPGFEPTIPASEQPQSNGLDRVATGIGIDKYIRKLTLHTGLTIRTLINLHSLH
jgi:hypothetical protein